MSNDLWARVWDRVVERIKLRLYTRLWARLYDRLYYPTMDRVRERKEDVLYYVK